VDEGPLDLAGVERLVSEFGSTGMLTRLIEMFGTQTPELLAEMRGAIAAHDAETLRETAHKLKGGCLTVAAPRAAALCSQLEIQDGAGSLDGATELVDQVQRAFEEAHAALVACCDD
jgi:HPt (histidine-containing phosphotransfer) domain-containing protein